jgi:cytochrome c oxidase subunit 3
MASSPASAFFYLLTAAHGAHLAGGLLAVSYITARAWSRSEWPGRSAAIAATAVYWHFMDVLWLALLGLLIWVG